MSEQLIHASCLCGRIKVKVTGPAKWSAHCHCKKCQKAHGAAFVTWVGVDLKSFKLVEGESNLIWYPSSETGKRAHCQHCGTPMLFWAERWQDEMHIARACIDSDFTMPVTAHAFYDSHVSWTSADPQLPKRGGTSGTDLIA